MIITTWRRITTQSSSARFLLCLDINPNPGDVTSLMAPLLVSFRFNPPITSSVFHLAGVRN